MINNAIEERAEKLLIDSKSFTVPVVLDNCLSFLNLSANRIEAEDNLSGFLAINDKVAQIGYNQSHHDNRIRFTIAHEIGHYILHAQSMPIFIDKNNGNDFSYLFRDDKSSNIDYMREKEANSFAAALLMPKKLIIGQFEKSKNKNDEKKLIEELAQTFKVSEQAMNIRLSQLGFLDYGI